MSLTTEQVALWKRNAEVVKSYETDIRVKILQDRIIALADEILAIREAQPVAVVISRGHLAHVTDGELELGTKLYTAPPAPAVPEEAKVGEMPFLGNSEPGYVRGWNDCRAAMLRGAK